jgi:hypothetical protein
VYTRHEIEGFIAFPALLGAFAVIFVQPSLQSAGMYVAATVGWTVIYWSLLNVMRSNAAAIILLTCGAAAAVIAVFVVSGWFGLRLPGYGLLVDQPAEAVAASMR